MAFALIFFPVLMAGIAFAIPSNARRPWVLPVAALIQSGLAATVLALPELGRTAPELVLDPLSRIVLLLVTVLFLFCSFYAVGYLKYRRERSNRIFCTCLLTSFGAMNLVIWSHHLGLMWVAIEATTLSTAPLIFFNRSPRSIEATWKYLLVGSVGIALALFGTFFLAYSAQHDGLKATLQFEDLLANAPQLSRQWLHAAFILLLIGYGTKMGLAPMHTWKPDAYGEAPGVVGALLAGGVTSCAFLAFSRVYKICGAAGEQDYAGGILIAMGILSMLVAGIFMLNQHDFKRMLAWSSVEHMGILILGLGIGKPALYGTVLHVLTNGMTKGVLFLTAGNIHRAYSSKRTEDVRGALRRLPWSGALFLLGFFAITGTPPFGPFVSEFAILKGSLAGGTFAVAALFLGLLMFVYVGMGRTVLQVIQGHTPGDVRYTDYRENILTVGPPVVFMLLVLLLGIYIPEPLQAMLGDAVAFLEGRP